jgi:hypothetical protein
MGNAQPASGLQVVMSFSHENFSELHRVWRAAASARGENVIARLEDGRGGGKVQVVDWTTRAVLHSADIVLATGFTQLGDEIVICGYDSLQFRDRRLNLLRTVSHRLFCNLHSVTEHPLGLVVAASSIDALLLVTPTGEVSTYWNALEHGYDVLPGGGRRRLDPAADHRGMFYLTGEQATHINGTTYWPARETVLATLFHQGHLVEIDPAGRTRVLLDDLAAPHSPRIREDGLVYLADSRRGRIVEYDGASGGVRYVTPNEPCPWLQTVSWIPAESLYLAADSTNGRAMLLRPDGTVVDQYRISKDWRLHEARLLEPSFQPAVGAVAGGS